MAETAMVSVQRSKAYRDEPILLVIDKEKLDTPAKWVYGQIRINALNLGSFEICDMRVLRDNPSIGLSSIEGIAKVSASSVIRSSQEEIEAKYISKFGLR